MTIRALSLVCFLLVASVWSAPARSYQVASSINYDVQMQTVSGYNRTWKDPWDADYYESCVYWMWDDVYGYMCALIQYQFNYAVVSGEGVTIAPQFAPTFYTLTAVDGTDVKVEFSLDHIWTYSAFHIGVYTANGQHFAGSDIYMQWCYYFCTPPVYQGTYWFSIGTTMAQTPVCVHAQLTLDSAALAVALTWSIEPWERAVTMRCDATGIVTYTHFSDSFGTYYGNATNDPCKSEVVYGFNDRGGDLHSHPRFTTTAQFNAGLGCLGNTNPQSDAALQALNVLNEDYSGGDITNGAPGAKYLKTPTGRVLRRDSIGQTQVFP